MKSIAFRKEQIAQVGYLLKDNEQRFKDALKADLGRPELETELYVPYDLNVVVAHTPSVSTFLEPT